MELIESDNSEMEDNNPNQVSLQDETLENLKKKLQALETEHKANMKEYKTVCKELKLKLDLSRQKSSNIEYVRTKKKYIRQIKSIELENNLNNVSHIQVLKFLKLIKESTNIIHSNIYKRIANQLARLLDNTYN